MHCVAKLLLFASLNLHMSYWHHQAGQSSHDCLRDQQFISRAAEENLCGAVNTISCSQ